MRIPPALLITASATLRPTFVLPVARLCFGLAVLAAALSLVGIAAAPFKITLDDFGHLASTLAGLAGLLGVQILLIMRLAGDASWQAQTLTRLCRTVADISLLGMVAGVFFCSSHLLQALSACVGFPFQDHAFSAADRAFGLDWEGFVAALNSSPLVVSALIASYFSIAVTLPVLMLVLLVKGKREELWELSALFMLGGLFTLTGACFAPALGGYTYYGPDPASTSEFVRQWPYAGTYFVSALLKIHGGHIDLLDLSQINGIVQFPSFHGIMAMVIMYMAWPYRLLALPLVVINLVMLVSTVPVGGHHGVDSLGSLAAVLASIAIVDRVAGRPSLTARIKRLLAREGEPQLAAA